MKLYIFRDSLFEYVAITIAKNRKQAIKFLKTNNSINDYGIKRLNKKDNDTTLEIVKIKEGIVIEGGGNG